MQPGFRHILVCAMPTDISLKGRARARLPEPPNTAGPFLGSGAGDLSEIDVRENSQVDTGLCGNWGQHGHLPPGGDGMASFVQSLEVGPENTATRQLHL